MTKFVFSYENSAKIKVSKNNTNTKVEEVGVYAVGCCDCHSFYFGKNDRDLKIRIQERKSVVREIPQNSAVARHCSVNNHRMNQEVLEIVHKNSYVSQKA